MKESYVNGLNGNELGSLGERMAKELLDQRYGACRDMRGVEHAQRDDIDFIAKQFSFEVKTYRHFGSYLWLETDCRLKYDKYGHGGQGWFVYTKADILLFVDPVDERILMVPTDVLRDVVSEHEDELAKVESGNGHCIKLPIDLLERERPNDYRWHRRWKNSDGTVCWWTEHEFTKKFKFSEI